MLGFVGAAFRIDITAYVAITSPYCNVSTINQLENEINQYYMRYAYVEVQSVPRSEHNTSHMSEYEYRLTQLCLLTIKYDYSCFGLTGQSSGHK
jgi:hypothetical protein